MYTVTTRHGDVQGRGLSAKEAADMILTYDGHLYEIRPGSHGLMDLWVSRHSQNSTIGARPLIKSVIFGTTEDEIWQNVITHADYWHGQSCLFDTDYDELSKIDE